MNDLTLFEHMDKELALWEYESSVNKMKSMRYKWEQLSVGMMRELELAHENLARPGARTDLATNMTRSHTWSEYCEACEINRETARRWLERWKQIKAQHLQLEDDIQIKDVIVEEEPKENPLKGRLDEAERIIKEKNKNMRILNKQIENQEKELNRLKEKEIDAEELNKIRDKIAKLKIKQSELLKDSDGVKVILKALVKGRDFFTKECMAIPALKVTENSKKLMHDDLIGLIELVENWLQAIKQRLI